MRNWSWKLCLALAGLLCGGISSQAQMINPGSISGEARTPPTAAPGPVEAGDPSRDIVPVQSVSGLSVDWKTLVFRSNASDGPTITPGSISGEPREIPTAAPDPVLAPEDPGPFGEPFSVQGESQTRRRSRSADRLEPAGQDVQLNQNNEPTLINDGSTTDGLARLANANGVGEAETMIAVDDESLTLTASQIGTVDPFDAIPLRTVWYSRSQAPTSGVYTVSADFKPNSQETPPRGGVMAWLDLANSTGISFQVLPNVSQPRFQLATVDFQATSANANENQDHLFNVDGSPADGSFESAWSELGDYDPTAFATFQLAFSEPTEADQELADIEPTARVTATVFQGEGEERVQVGQTIELLTDLPVPAPADHRAGYYAYWVSTIRDGTIGQLDNLTAINGFAERANEPPTVTLTMPSDGARFTPPATIDLEAEAEDSDGSISEVEFFAGEMSLGIVTEAPYTFTWEDVPEGQYTVTAKATDDRGETAVSDSVNITVSSPMGEPPITVARDGDQLVLSWPSEFTGYMLQVKTDLGQAEWTDITDSTSSNQYEIDLSQDSVQFFRLVQGEGNGNGNGGGTGPALTIELTDDTVTVSWPADVSGYVLQSTTELGSGNWQEESVSGGNSAEFPASDPRKFFRLVQE